MIRPIIQADRRFVTSSQADWLKAIIIGYFVIDSFVGFGWIVRYV